VAIALRSQPAVSINQFIGGFKSTSDYTDLLDQETNSSENIEYGPNGDLVQRKGSVKILNTRLTSTSATAVRPITGHYNFTKLGASSFDLVMVGDAIYNYTSSTASVIASGLLDNSAVFWNSVQIQDPRSASDDIVLMTNGEDNIHVWNGSGTAVLLSSFTSATQVPIGKYMLQHENRVYVANITDSDDVDSPVKVQRSEIGTDGAPNPHRFTETFYIGGSDSDGEVQGQMILNNNIFYYTERAIWRFIPGIGDVNDLEKVNNNIGLYAPRSLVSTGNLHIFLSERGVFAFDGAKIMHLSDKVDNDLLFNSTQGQLQNAVAEFDYENNQYKLYVPGQGSNRNDRGYSYDLRLKAWQPPITGRQISTLSHFTDSNGRVRLIYGDYLGYVYRDGAGVNDGISSDKGQNHYATTSTLSIVTLTSGTFPTANDGLGGVVFNVISGTGENQARRILSNTSSTITLETPLSLALDSTSLFTVGAIDSFWKSKDYDFVGHDITKLFRHITVRMREEGNFNLNVQYIIDFKKLTIATIKKILMFIDGWVWGISVWGTGRWGRRPNIKKRFSLRGTNSQSLNGTHMALKFSNRRANEEYRITGIDLEFEAVGKR
jgi:hypothetical protein